MKQFKHGRVSRAAFCSGLLSLAVASPGLAQDAPALAKTAEASASAVLCQPEPAPEAAPPMPCLDGCLWDRPKLGGSPLGAR